MAHIIAFLNQKGGSGKTTLATNVASYFNRIGARTLLVDSDPQGSSRDWHAAREGEGFPVIGIDRPTLERDVAEVAKGRDWIVIDGAPQAHDLAISAIKAADLVVIPVQPSPYDLWATSDLIELIKQRQDLAEGRPLAMFLISRQIQNTKLSVEVRGALEEYGLPVMESSTTQRVVYANAAASGKSVLEEDPKGAAAQEIKQIGLEIQEKINAKSR